MDTFAKRLVWAREQKELSQEDLANLVGVSQSTIGNYEAGLRNNPRKITKLAECLGVSAKWLEEGVGGPYGASAKVLSIAPPGSFPVSGDKYRKIPVYGKAMGGFPERIWDDDGQYPAGFSDQYAEIASSDPNAFLVPVEGVSMIPRFNPGEFALVEPGTDPEIEDDVLVRLGDGRTMIKKLLSRRGVVRLGSYHTSEVISSPPEEITWMYYVAHPVPARKIKQRM